MNFIKKNWDTIKRYLISSAVTFFGTFFASLVILIKDVDVTTISASAFAGLIVVAFRFAVKALIELIAIFFTKK